MFGKKSPIVEAANHLVAEVEKARKLAAMLPEGALISTGDNDIQQLGEAMLLDGVDTTGVNTFMLDQLEEKYSRPTKIVRDYFPFVAIPGNENREKFRLLETLLRPR